MANFDCATITILGSSKINVQNGWQRLMFE